MGIGRQPVPPTWRLLLAYANTGGAGMDRRRDVGLATGGRLITTSVKLALARAYAIISQSSLEAIQLPLMFIRMTVTTMTSGKAP